MNDSTEDLLKGVVADLLQIENVDPRKSFIDHGGDSWTTIQLTAAIIDAFYVGLTSEDVIGCASIREIADMIQRSIDFSEQASPREFGRESKLSQLQLNPEKFDAYQHSNEVPLTANRFTYFFKRLRNLENWNVCSHVLEMVDPFDDRAFSAAVRHLWVTHEGLRLQIHCLNGQWAQTIISSEEGDPLEVISLPPDISEVSRRRVIEDSISRAHNGFSFPGPLFRVLMFAQTGSPALVYLLAHHLSLDAHAFTLIRNSLFDTYLLYKAGQTPADTREGTSMRSYAVSSINYWLSREEEQLRYWNSMPWHRLDPLRTDFAMDTNSNQEGDTVYEVCKVGLVYEPWLRRLLGDGSRQTALCLLLCAVARAYLRWTGTSPVHLAMVLHGRDSYFPGVDLSKTIGWISETVPLFLDGQLENNDFFQQASRQLTQARISGKSYGILKHFGKRPETSRAFEGHSDPEISLNFVSPTQRGFLKSNAFVPRPEFVANFVEKPSTERVFLISGGVYVADDVLHISWDFSQKLFRSSSVQKFCKDCMSIFLDLGRQWSAESAGDAADPSRTGNAGRRLG